MTVLPLEGQGIETAPPKCVPVRFGLLQTAEVEEPETHWEMGFFHQQESCKTITSVRYDCVPDFEEHATKNTDGSGLTWPHGDAFALVAPYECSVFGQPLEEAYRFAERRLDQAEDREVERVFWSGLDSNGNTVRQTLGEGATLTTFTNLTPLTVPDLVTGVALLEEFAGHETSCQPVIHAPKVLAAFFDENNLVTTYSDGVRRRSTLNPVVFGGGYTRDVPNLVTGPNEAWLFVSGSIKVLRGPVFLAAAEGDPASIVDREKNDVTVYAERMYGFAIGGCALAGVRVALG